MQTIAIGFHDVVPDGTLACAVAPGHTIVYTLRQSDFRAHLEAVQSCAGHGQLARADRLEVSDSTTRLFLTFDDGAASAYTCVAPELERFGWPGYFFIVTDWIGRRGFLDRAQIRELRARRHVIGSHSSSHPEQMWSLPWNELVQEWSKSCQVLSDILGEPVTVASVPGGYYSHEVGKAAAAAGIETLFTSEPTTACSVVGGCRILGRYAIRRSTPANVSGALASGMAWPRRQQAALWLAKKAAKRLAGPWYPRVRRMLLAQAAQG